MFTTLYIDLFDAQVKYVDRSCQNSNSSQLLCMSLLPARMKKIQSKMKGMESSQHFSHYKFMGFFQTIKCR